MKLKPRIVSKWITKMYKQKRTDSEYFFRIVGNIYFYVMPVFINLIFTRLLQIIFSKENIIPIIFFWSVSSTNVIFVVKNYHKLSLSILTEYQLIRTLCFETIQYVNVLSGVNKMLQRNFIWFPTCMLYIDVQVYQHYSSSIQQIVHQSFKLVRSRNIKKSLTSIPKVMPTYYDNERPPIPNGRSL